VLRVVLERNVEFHPEACHFSLLYGDVLFDDFGHPEVFNGLGRKKLF